jgi:CHAT domain-containing protein
MNLSDTRLVVLSACDTGIGEVEAGEGVLGLRRSFRLAGAATVVMSLWKVPDGETTQLMIEFYRRLKLGESCTQALRQSQLLIKEQNCNPYFWGAFISEGNPGAIRLDSSDEVSTFQ